MKLGHDRRPWRLREVLSPWSLFGALFLVIAALGAVAPLLPTTPFVLLAAACFAKSSPRAHAWLMRSRLFGPIIQSWSEHRCIGLRVKCVAIAMMAVVGGSSVLFVVSAGWPKILGTALIALGCISVLAIPSCPRRGASGSA